MGELSAWLSGVIRDYSMWAGPLFALIAFCESTAFVGAIIPATPVLLLVGGLIGSGELDAAQVIPTAILGATLGYWLSFAVGRAAGRQLISHSFLRGQRRSVARARLFFRRWGASSLIFGRYVLGPFQSLLPFVAGAAGMNKRRFWLMNIISSAIWVPICLAPGYFAARGSNLLGINHENQNQITTVLTLVSGGAILICVTFVLGKGLLHSFRQR